MPTTDGALLDDCVIVRAALQAVDAGRTETLHAPTGNIVVVQVTVEVRLIALIAETDVRYHVSNRPSPGSGCESNVSSMSITEHFGEQR